MTTLEEVLTRLPTLTAAERTRVLRLLEADPQLGAQRAANQIALVHLDARIATDDDEDDAWWEAFTDALDADRLSNRPLFAGSGSRVE
jgi:hypothetical protein